MSGHGPDRCGICKRMASAVRDIEVSRRELADQINGRPDLHEAVLLNLAQNAAADVLDAMAEAINEEDQ